MISGPIDSSLWESRLTTSMKLLFFLFIGNIKVWEERCNAKSE